MCALGSLTENMLVALDRNRMLRVLDSYKRAVIVDLDKNEAHALLQTEVWLANRRVNERKQRVGERERLMCYNLQSLINSHI